MDSSFDILQEAMDAASRAQYWTELQERSSGATKCYANNQYPYTIMRLLKNREGIVKYIVVQGDDPIHISGNCQEQNAIFAYQRNINGDVDVLKQCRDGRWRSVMDIHGPYYALGSRRYYVNTDM
jgi:hypothetical protein